MTQLAWISMLLAWTVIIGATLYCFYRLLTSQRQFGASGDE